MLHSDRLTFAILLCKIHLKGVVNEQSLDNEFNFFLRAKEGLAAQVQSGPVEGLTQEQQEAVNKLSLR